MILLPFPFSDLSASKLRPALLLASVGRGDWLLCQITSNPYADPHAVMLQDEDFAEGNLQRVSYLRARRQAVYRARVPVPASGGIAQA